MPINDNVLSNLIFNFIIPVRRSKTSEVEVSLREILSSRRDISGLVLGKKIEKEKQRENELSNNMKPYW